LSKYDGEIRAVAEVSGDLDELLAALGRSIPPAPERHDAMAHYLSGEEGWREALKALRGAFAKTAGGGTGLTGGSES
jgi:hypothetical protein